jgi:broad specificity phosphatase PhoE
VGLEEAERTAADSHRRTQFAMRELVDLDHGSWTGLTPAEVEARNPEAYRRFREDPRACTPPDGERVAAVGHRMHMALEVLAMRHANEEVVAVSHEIPIRLLWSGLAGVDGSAMWDLTLPTAGVVTIRGDGGD